MSSPDFSFLQTRSTKAAPRLLGCVLERTVAGRTIRVRIVETEAYDQQDAASHSYKGKTSRTDIMFGPAGCLYVYFTYGMYYCCNIVTDQEGVGSAVLIRAVEPLEGAAYLERVRDKVGVEATNGPAKLCQALGIDKTLNGHNIRYGPLRLIPQPSLGASMITVTPRIGISKAQEMPWRFYITDNPYVSRR